MEAGSRIVLVFRPTASPHPRSTGSAREDQGDGSARRICAALPRGALVFASTGPTGRMLRTGETTREILGVFGEQFEILAEARADALILETMSDLEGARIAVEAARRTGLPVVACMMFDAGKNQDRTLIGVRPNRPPRPLGSGRRRHRRQLRRVPPATVRSAAG